MSHKTVGDDRVRIAFKMPEGATPEEAEALAEAILNLANVLHDAISPDGEGPTIEIHEVPDPREGETTT